MALPKSITDNLKEGGTLTLIKTSAEGGKAIIGEIRTISAVHSNYVVTRGSD